MNYKQTLDFLYSRLPMFQRTGPRGYKIDLATTEALDEYFEHPHRSYKTIHIAGTNGKGSVSNMLAAVLQTAGYKTGLYTSPHLIDFRERIRVNGEMVSEDKVVDFVGRHRDIIERLKPSFFELTAAMAFDYFGQQKVDVAIIETGLGGRLDSTNIITPQLSVITNIGFDHTESLGDTLEQIAGEKAGIIKSTVPVVIGETQPETENVFKSKAKQSNSEIVWADQIYKIDYSMQSISGKQILNVYKTDQLRYKDIELDLLGFYQRKNLITCLCAIDKLIELDYRITKEHLYQALQQSCKLTGLAGRWQIVGHNPLVVCDTAHNREGLTQVLHQISQTAHKQLHIVLGFVNDKNVDGLLNMFPKDAKYYVCQADIPRAMNSSELHSKCIQNDLQAEDFRSVEQAYTQALKASNDKDFIYIGGSTFIVAGFLKFYNA